MKMIDAHIHLDHYKDKEISSIIEESNLNDALISVSFNLESCLRNLQLSQKFQKVKPAFGFHPEQPIPTEEQQSELLNWMNEHRPEMIAIGEVGLPYYLRLEQKVSRKQYAQYIDLLETFIQLAKKWEKPIVLHAVYDDAPIVCDLLEKYSVTKAHFHWFKGDQKTIKWMIANGYHISITPDVVYEQEIQQLVQNYPVEQMMIETDGPWPFEGPFKGKMTHPDMMIESIGMIAKIKHLTQIEVAERLLQNTKAFYQI
ncbi:TatD family hydrolase [Neobacillus sp. PS3-40]|uniref:TatD family hydrolase n=1 Tax=Neobacillus sp. PS3-40 TaxID=3070679 RepID=UPI0027E17DFD|nr:TatD family hydrolase [Neobacillus sp. PS3-40]WML44238.1 TatD family hydrolase [Neobacillus sp. PS3-40]